MNRWHRWARAAGSCLFVAVGSQAHAAEPKLPAEGWTSWEEPAVDGAPAWCCYRNGEANGPAREACRLDEPDGGYNVRNDETTSAVKVYVKTTGGRIERLRVLSADCPVETKTPVQHQYGVLPEESVRWLSSQVTWNDSDAMTHRPLGESALAALGMHRGNAARDALARYSRDPNLETRKWSVFWLAMLRGAEGAEITSSVMFNDEDVRVREHAAFALSQSHTSRVAPDLVKLGNTDRSSQVRAKAWFWLAHTGAPESEQAIGAALRKDSDHGVQEQAIFALSRLPGERAARALIAAAEDRALPREVRKKAVFWLSQSRSEAAQAYLEKVLAAG
jgi:hypothetical protein